MVECRNMILCSMKECFAFSVCEEEEDDEEEENALSSDRREILFFLFASCFVSAEVQAFVVCDTLTERSAFSTVL